MCLVCGCQTGSGQKLHMGQYRTIFHYFCRTLLLLYPRKPKLNLSCWNFLVNNNVFFTLSVYPYIRTSAPCDQTRTKADFANVLPCRLITQLSLNTEFSNTADAIHTPRHLQRLLAKDCLSGLRHIRKFSVIEDDITPVGSNELHSSDKARPLRDVRTGVNAT